MSNPLIDGARLARHQNRLDEGHQRIAGDGLAHLRDIIEGLKELREPTRFSVLAAIEELEQRRKAK